MLQLWKGYLPGFLDGLRVTMELTGTSLLIGLPLGVVLALASTASKRMIRWTFIAVVEIGRGAPALIVLYFVYYGLPQLHLTWSSFISAMIALGFETGAYTAEIFRAGINAVPAGQREASQALGLSRSKELRLIVLPQALRLVVPPVVGFSILLFQTTSLAYAVSVPELLSRAYNEASITYQFTATLTLAGVMYAVISLAAVALLKFRWPHRADESVQMRHDPQVAAATR
jgi:polar amino acid transport system permease protein